MLSGVCWELMMPALTTEEKEFGSWATPTTMDSLPPKSAKALHKEITQVRPGRSQLANLRDQVANPRDIMQKWPTPTVNGNYNQKGMSDTSGDGLATAVKNKEKFPTPKTTDTNAGRTLIDGTQGNQIRINKDGTKRMGANLADVVTKFPTPTSQDAKNSTLPVSQRNRDSIPGALLQEGTAPGGQLNPDWVEWLMGWPIGWTDLRPLATGKSLQAWQQHFLYSIIYDKKLTHNGKEL